MKPWTINEIIKLYKITRHKQSIYRDEANGLIPKASRVSRGNQQVRAWQQSDLPEIGKAYGFLSPAKRKHSIAIYTAKGGVLKTTLSYNLARMLALNNINTLVIGLDIQCSISDILSKPEEISSIEDVKLTSGLYEASKGNVDSGVPIEDVILTTDLPTLSYIPENINLALLEQRIRDKNKREYFLDKLIDPIRSKYDVIIFDNAPSWNFLIQNSLMASNIIISPMACDAGTYKSVSQNIGILNDFKKEMSPSWKHFIVIPTLLEKTKLSIQIEAQYKTMYPELITATSIRRAVLGQESALLNSSVIESDSNSPLANDYYELIKEVWDRIQDGA